VEFGFRELTLWELDGDIWNLFGWVESKRSKTRTVEKEKFSTGLQIVIE
jgi:hypothetical protein